MTSRENIGVDGGRVADNGVDGTEATASNNNNNNSNNNNNNNDDDDDDDHEQPDAVPPGTRPRRTPGVMPLSQLYVATSRLRAVDQALVQRLVVSIMNSGLLQPIGVAADGRIIFGVHRYLALKELQREEVSVIIFENFDDGKEALLEIDENLLRGDLSALERAEHLKLRGELYLRLHPETARYKIGGHRKSASDKMSFADSFVAVTATATGLNKRTIHRLVEIAKNISSEAREILRPTDAAKSYTTLRHIAQLPATEQFEAAVAVSRGEKLKPVVSAGRAAGERPAATTLSSRLPDAAVAASGQVPLSSTAPSGLNAVYDDLHVVIVALRRLLAADQAAADVPAHANTAVEAAERAQRAVAELLVSTADVSVAPTIATAVTAPAGRQAFVERKSVEDARERLGDVHAILTDVANEQMTADEACSELIDYVEEAISSMDTALGDVEDDGSDARNAPFASDNGVTP